MQPSCSAASLPCPALKRPRGLLMPCALGREGWGGAEKRGRTAGCFLLTPCSRRAAPSWDVEPVYEHCRRQLWSSGGPWVWPAFAFFRYSVGMSFQRAC